MVMNRAFVVGGVKLFGTSTIVHHVLKMCNLQSLLAHSCTVTISSLPRKALDGKLEKECSFRQEYMTNMLGCSKKDTIKFLHNNQELLKMTCEKFTKMIDLFAANSITEQDVFTSPDIFKRKYETLKARFEDLNQNTDLKNIRLSMINLSQRQFCKRYKVYVEDSRNREEFNDKHGLLTKSLGCSETFVASLVKTCSWFDNSKLSTIRKKMDVYLSMDPEFATILTERIWLLTFPIDVIETKLNDLKRLRIPRFIWTRSLNHLMKSTGEEYQAHLQKMVHEQAIYADCMSKEEYLCKQLECGESELKSMIRKYPTLLSVSIFKLQNHLHMLHKEFGFSNADIIKNALVFKYSKENLQFRFYELQKYSYDLPDLYYLTLSGKNYKKYVDKLKLSSL